jgi:hypothetical protein
MTGLVERIVRRGGATNLLNTARLLAINLMTKKLVGEDGVAEQAASPMHFPFDREWNLEKRSSQGIDVHFVSLQTTVPASTFVFSLCYY